MQTTRIVVPEKIGKIAPEIYGHFSEHIGGVFYGGLWVGRDSYIPNEKGFRKDALDLLRKIGVPVLRWPGGCFAETYNWRDGIGNNRPVRHNWWTRNDGRYEAYVLSSPDMRDHNTFDEPTKIAPKSIKLDIRKAISVPAASVISMKIKLGS